MATTLTNMVKVIEVKQSERTDGTAFFSVKIQGGVEFVQSQQTGAFYITARTCLIPTTFDEETANAMIGSELPGTVKRVESEPYDYTIKATGEIIKLSHSYQYAPDDALGVMPTKPQARHREFANAEV